MIKLNFYIQPTALKHQPMNPTISLTANQQEEALNIELNQYNHTINHKQKKKMGI